MAEEPNSSSSSTLPRNDNGDISVLHGAGDQEHNVRFERDTTRDYLRHNPTNKPPGLQWWPPNLRLGRSDLCTPCRAIDFEAAFTARRPLEHERQRWIYVHEQNIQSFDQTERNSEGIEWPVNANCQLCRYLANAAPTRLKSREEYTLVFHNELQPNHDEVLIKVVPFSLRDASLLPFDSEFGRARTKYSFNNMRSASNTIICHRNRPVRKAGTPQIVSPNFDGSLAQSWFDMCKLEHTMCGVEDDMPIPKTMLIDCINRRLVSVDSDYKPRPRFIALSYVWGLIKELPGAQQQTLTYGLSMDLPLDLPLTINDAITVTKALGFQYLWVDQYCIDQKNKEDKHRQILQMDLIYKCADLTIVAAAGDGCDYGLPGVSTCRRNVLDPFMLDDVFTFGIHPREDRQYWKKGSWHTRGWTFQEALLARRLLVFSETGMYYECRGHTKGAWQSELWGGVECAPSEDSRPGSLWGLSGAAVQSVVGSATLSSLPSVGEPDGYFENFEPVRLRGSLESFCTYTQLVTQYTTRNLTYASDALNAFRGAANALQEIDHPVYSINGIPFVMPGQPEAEDGLAETSFLCGLSWRSRAGGTGVASTPEFPSWSWANSRVWSVTWTSSPEDVLDELYYEFESILAKSIYQAHGMHIEFDVLDGNKDWLFEDSDTSAQRADFLITQGRKRLYALAEFAKAFWNLTPLSRFRRNPTALCFKSRMLCSRFTRDKLDYGVCDAWSFRGMAYSDLGYGTMDIAVHVDVASSTHQRLESDESSGATGHVHDSYPCCLIEIPDERLYEEIVSERCSLVLLCFDSEEAWALLVEWLGGEPDEHHRTARRVGFFQFRHQMHPLRLMRCDHLPEDFLRCFSVETDLRLV